MSNQPITNWLLTIIIRNRWPKTWWPIDYSCLCAHSAQCILAKTGSLIMFLITRGLSIAYPAITHWSHVMYYHSMHFFPFLFIGRKPRTWPANNCLQIIVRSCVIPSKCVLLQMIFFSVHNCIHAFFFMKNGRSLPKTVREWFNMKTNLVIKW